MKEEKIAILMSCLNNESTILRALNSLANNTKKPDLIVVGDNDSDDNSYELLCNQLKAKKVRVGDKLVLPPQAEGNYKNIPIKIFRARRSNNGKILNLCMTLIKTPVEYVGFMSPEDLYEKDKIEKSINMCINNQFIACVVSDYNIQEKGGRKIRHFLSSFKHDKIPYDINFIMRSKVFLLLKSGFNEQLSTMEKYDLLLRISEVGLIYHIPEALHTKSKTILHDDTAIKQIKDIAFHRRNANAKK